MLCNAGYFLGLLISSILQIPSSIEKVAEIDSHIGAAMSGLTPDARTLIEHARVETQVFTLPSTSSATLPLIA